jgi:hypothetical protein
MRNGRARVFAMKTQSNQLPRLNHWEDRRAARRKAAFEIETQLNRRCTYFRKRSHRQLVASYQRLLSARLACF